MDKETIRKLLPEEPRPGLLQWAINECEEDLGPQYLSWRTEWVPIYDMESILTGGPIRKRRVAACTCLKCGAQMYTEYFGTTLQFWIGEDGKWWGLDPTGITPPWDEEDEQENGHMVEVGDGEALYCPMCYETLHTIQEKNLRGGRRKQLLIVSIETMEKYGDLQWSDGELCIILPRSYADLVQEGNVLRHCVGGYSESHINGRDTIFFVRKYRRQERCYYTLDINMTERPHRNQLHGYGNERHGVHKEHRHKIPKKVLDFCDRWEREVLMPWYREQQNKQKVGTSA